MNHLASPELAHRDAPSGAAGRLSPPNTAQRPQLSAAEAAAFVAAAYFAEGGLHAAPDGPWRPAAIADSRADFVVGPGGSHASVQAAVNAAIRSGRVERQYIHILPGVYRGAVYIPAFAPPLSLVGCGCHGSDVRIELCLDSRMTVAEYIQRVNPAAEFQPGDPAWHMYQACAGRPDDKSIDTPSAAVFWSQASDLQLKNFSIVNSQLDTVDGSTHQAVALRSDGDRCQLEGLRLISRQDTFFCNAGEAPRAANAMGAYARDRDARVLATECYIEGDTDYVFGSASAVFQRCEFHSVSSRRRAPTIVFAPDTHPGKRFGFLALDCRFTADAWLQQDGRSFLGRSWDQGAGNTGYLPGKTANGQLVIRDSFIDAACGADSPWDHAATTRRPHRGNADPARDLDDPGFNRLWEFNNYGPGAAAR